MQLVMKIEGVQYNIVAHDLIFKRYEKMHIEIFNPIEQARLHNCLKSAISCIKSISKEKIALDYGCGSGNLTTHMLDLGMRVVSADVSDNFLSMIKTKFEGSKKSEILKINGYDLSGINDNSFDFVSLYSVLHHVPDYLQILKELIRVIKPGGIIYIDHERSEDFWRNSPVYANFIRLSGLNLFFSWDNLKKYFKSSSYIHGIRRLLDSRYQPEGDIHVWPDDHIEWSKIENIFSNEGCEIVLKENYLLYKKYPLKIYEAFKSRCNDCCLIIARKNSSFKKGVGVF
jgi:ubiquinone/menaquinone biosynthesis C-methylase UbiE